MVAFGWGLHIFHNLAYVVTLITLKLLRCHGGNVNIWRWNTDQRITFFSKWRKKRKLSYATTKNQIILKMKPRDLRKTVGGLSSFVFRCCWVGRLLTESSIRGDFFWSRSLRTWSHRRSVPVSILKLRWKKKKSQLLLRILSFSCGAIQIRGAEVHDDLKWNDDYAVRGLQLQF